MIDSEFIIRYTNGLYSVSPADRPSYDEFRDMFSHGQVKSKEWLMQELLEFDAFIPDAKVIIVGCWFGTLGMLLKKKYPKINLSLLDFDPRCKKFLDAITWDMPDIRNITEDMYKYDYYEDIFINTSCEHVENLDYWLKLLPKKKVVILQSNDLIEVEDHKNCVISVQEFIDKVNLPEIWFSGELNVGHYNRYMIIGRT